MPHPPLSADRPRAVVVVFGVFPPPVTGMSLCTGRVAEYLEPRFQVYRANLSDGSSRITWPFRVRKFLRMLGALVRLAMSRKLRGAVLYMPLNARAALYYNIAAAAVGRMRGWRIVVHHHVYLYLNNRDNRLRLLDRIMGRRGLHLVLCPDMKKRLRELYDIQAPCTFLPSTIMLGVDDAGDSAVPPDAPLERVQRLGHISNLTEAKGALVAINTFAKLRDEGHDVELIMAGPMTESTVEREILAAQQRFDGSFRYLGPVYGDAKTAFFQNIDVLLFPSTFRYEAQPIVLSEAFSFGVPALSIGISCIPSLVDNLQWHVCPQKDYVEFAGRQIKRWRDRPDEYAVARQFARRRAESLKREAEQALSRFASWISGEDADDFVAELSPAESLNTTAAAWK